MHIPEKIKAGTNSIIPLQIELTIPFEIKYFFLSVLIEFDEQSRLFRTLRVVW